MLVRLQGSAPKGPLFYLPFPYQQCSMLGTMCCCWHGSCRKRLRILEGRAHNFDLQAGPCMCKRRPSQLDSIVFTPSMLQTPCGLLQREVEERSAKLAAVEERCAALEHEVDALSHSLRTTEGKLQKQVGHRLGFAGGLSSTAIVRSRCCVVVACATTSIGWRGWRAAQLMHIPHFTPPLASGTAA